MSKKAVPKYSLHKPTGQARVRIKGKDHWLGKHGTLESRQRYAEILLKWEQETDAESRLVTFGELSMMFKQFAKSHYVKNGKQTSEVTIVKSSLKFMNQVCRNVPLAEIRPRHLKEARQRMIEHGHSRSTVNKHVQRIRRAVKWAVGEELCDASVLVGLQAVPDLKRGRSQARETEPVKPVPIEFVNSVKKHLQSSVWSAIQFQLLTGARPGEALIIRGCDLDMSGPVWTYRPESHKNEHHGKQRVICIGPKAQVVLRTCLSTDLSLYLFGTELSGRQQPYRRDSYSTAIRRACLEANVPHWSPNQLRHNFATNTRKQFGIEKTRATLGHSSAVTSEIYAEMDVEAARAVVAKIG